MATLGTFLLLIITSRRSLCDHSVGWLVGWFVGWLVGVHKILTVVTISRNTKHYFHLL